MLPTLVPIAARAYGEEKVTPKAARTSTAVANDMVFLRSVKVPISAPTMSDVRTCSVTSTHSKPG